jgi:hypothetical protein
LLASRDGSRVYAVASHSEGTLGEPDFRRLHELIVIDAGKAAIEKRIPIDCTDVQLSGSWMVETEVGRVRLPVKLAGGTRYNHPNAIATVDPVCGVASTAPIESFSYHLWMSPRGRYALMPNYASIPVRDAAMLSLAGLPLGPKTRYYAAAVQVWEVDPPRYVRTIAAAWLTFAELPDNNRPDQKRAAYEAILAACDNQPAGALGPPPLTAERYPADPARQNVTTVHHEFVDRTLDDIVWSEDEQSFWARTYPGLWSWVGIDGTASPRLSLARPGANEVRWGLLARPTSGPSRVEPATGRTARFWYRASEKGTVSGTAIITAEPSRHFQAKHVISTSHDNWRALPYDTGEIANRILQLSKVAKTDVVKLPSLGADHCIAAIDKLARGMPRLVKKVRRGEPIALAFDHRGDRLDEAAFFGHVETLPQAAPALRRLVGTVVTGKGAFHYDELPFQDGGWPLFAPAAKALGVLDDTALDLVEAYGNLLDDEHALYFGDQVIPAIVKAQGWTEPVVDFGVWALLSVWNVLPGLWRDWGMDGAVAARLPAEAFAARILHAINEGEKPELRYRFGHPRLYELWQALSPLTPYEDRLFAALDAATPNYELPD